MTFRSWAMPRRWSGNRFACAPRHPRGRVWRTETLSGRLPGAEKIMLVVGRMAVQRDPTLWDDPLRFDPERFSPENFKALDRWQYIPFGGGPRSCIGDHFAMLEVTLALARRSRRRNRLSGSRIPTCPALTMIAGGPISISSVRPRR